ncbi:MAG: rhomboid family intramembrane serine protease [Burkholderiales bacterium]|nr:rhomboid family intramembrane serine protease [Burkholderiales bacterium]
MRRDDLRHARLVGAASTPDRLIEQDRLIEHDRRRWQSALVLSAAFALALWLVRTLEAFAGTSFLHLGIYPRQWTGLAGILLAPFVHGSWGHLVANTTPVIVLGTALLYGYPRAARIVVPVLFLAVGLGVWLFARPSYHVGASGLTFGAMFFVFAIGVLRRDRRAIALAMIVFFMYGGMVWGVLPGDPQISFESHLAGALTGVTLAVLLRDADPRPPEKRYSWELEREAAEDLEWVERIEEGASPGSSTRLPGA